MGFPVKWPASNFSDNLVTSVPQCLDENRQLNVKECKSGFGWTPPAIHCNYTEGNYELAEKCPGNYVSVTDEICIRLISQHPFRNDICDDNLFPLTIYNLTDSEKKTVFTYLTSFGFNQTFWLPVKQLNPDASMKIGNLYTIDELRAGWTLPAFHGERVVVHDNCPTCTFTEHGGCLAFTPVLNSDNRFNSTLINCNLNRLPAFCMFRKVDILHRLACPEDYVASLMPQDSNLICSAIHPLIPLDVTEVCDRLLYEHCPQHTALQLNSVASTFHFEQLARQSLLSEYDRCLFGITPRQIAVNSSIFVELFLERRLHSFVNWDVSMGLHDFNVSSNHILSVNDQGKWFWEANNVSCIVCTQSVQFMMPRLELTYDSIEVKLKLTVVNANFLLTRFTNDLPFMCYAEVHNQYTYNLGATLISDGLYDIQLIGPGIYWCSGHVIQQKTLLSTERLFAQGIVMSMNVEYDCQQGNCHSFEQRFKSFLLLCRVNEFYVVDPALIHIEEVRQVTVHFTSGTRLANILFHVRVNILNEEAIRSNEQNELNLSEEMLTYYFIRQRFRLISNIRNDSMEFQIRSVNSTDFCLPSSISMLTDINWLGARIGETIESVEQCFDSNGRPLRRMCVGDTEYGGQWIRLSSETECLREDSSELTDSLQNLIDNFEDPEQTEDIIEKVRNLVTNSSDILVRMDIYFVSKIVGRATSFLGERAFSMGELQNLVVIYNNLMLVDNRVARSSAAFNSTNVLLESLELILMHEASALLAARENPLTKSPSTNVPKMSESSSYGAEISVKDPGIVVNTSPMLINIVIDPMLTDISGVALLKEDKYFRFNFDKDGLRGYKVQFLHRNQSLADLLLQPDLRVASFLPINLLRDILVTNPEAKLVFTIFYNDVLFQTVDNTTYIKSDGKIIAVSVPGVKSLPDFFPIYVKADDSIDDYCGYWDYDNTDGWSEDGCYRLAQNPTTKIVMCVCNHLTHFAYLLKGNSSRLEDLHLRSLQLITVLGCTFSLIGIIGIYITAIQFRSWRSKTSTKYLLQLSTAIAFQMILLAFVNTAPVTQLLLLTNNEAWCIVIGVLLHYFVLAMFFWMLIIAYLQFIRYVIVFNHVKTPRFLLKSSLLGWTLPMIPVLLVVSVDRNTYVPDLSFSESQICYPSGYSLYFGILLPIGVIVGANLVIFILVNYNLLRGTNAVCKAGDRNTKLSQLRLSIFLFFLLGLTWIFGLMSTAFSETSIVFSYLFCLTSTLQGFVMFLYFVILDPVARNLWLYFFKRICFHKKGNIDIRKDTSSKDSY